MPNGRTFIWSYLFLLTFSGEKYLTRVTCPSLTINKVVRPENLSIGSSLNCIHSPRFQINQNCSGYIVTPLSLVVVDLNLVNLIIRGHLVLRIFRSSDKFAGWVKSMLLGNDFPKLKQERYQI